MELLAPLMPDNPLPKLTSASERKPSAMESWLASSLERVAARHALLVVQQGVRITPLAGIPTTHHSDRLMGRVAERALAEKRVLVRAEVNPLEKMSIAERSVYVGFSMRIAGRPGAVVFELLVGTDDEDATILQRVSALVLRRAEEQTDLCASNSSSTPTLALKAKSLSSPASLIEPVAPAESVSALVAEQGVLLSAVAAMVDQPDLNQSLHALASNTAQQFRCLRVYVGCVVSRKVVIRAVSGLVNFDPRSAVMVDTVQAMNETKLLGSTIRVPDTIAERIPPQSHASLAEQLNNPALMSVPLTTDNRVVGVLMLERDRAFTDHEALQLERLSLLVSPMLMLKIGDDMGTWEGFQRLLGRGLRSVFGFKRLGLKVTLFCCALLAILSTTHTELFRVDANASVEAKIQRAVVSGFPSFLSNVEARAGDLVKSGDVLAQLDVEELQLDRIKWQGEMDKLNKEYRANLAQRDRSKVRVLEAQRSQAQAKVDLIDAQIARATLRAPIDGVVISGDHFQSLGRPVDRGELLFEVASLDDFLLILELDEKDIGWVQVGSTGQLRLRSLTAQTFPFDVTSITPVSEPGEGANTFRVEAKLEKLPQRLRPGMQGVAKIEVEHRAVGWIWTRSFVDWFRMQIWKLGGF